MVRISVVLLSLFISQLSFAGYEREWSCRGYYKERTKLKSIRMNILYDKEQRDTEKKRKVTISEGMHNFNTSATFRPISYKKTAKDLKIKLTKTRTSGAVELLDLQFYLDLEYEVTHEDGVVAYPAVALTDYIITPFESRPSRQKWKYPVLSCIKGKWDTAWSDEEAYQFEPPFGLQRLESSLQD